MKLQFFLSTALLLLSSMPGQADEEKVALAKAAELGCHRLERLISLPRENVPISYLNKFHSLAVTTLDPIANNGASFKVIMRQWPGADGKEAKVEIPLAADGKAIKGGQVVSPELESGNAFSWPVVDPVTLAENSLHILMKRGETEPKYKALVDSLSSVTVEPRTADQKAIVNLFSIDEKLKAHVVLDYDGSEEKAVIEILP